MQQDVEQEVSELDRDNGDNSDGVVANDHPLHPLHNTDEKALPSALARSQSSSQMTSPPPSTPPSAVEDNVEPVPKGDLVVVPSATSTHSNGVEAFPTPTTAVEQESFYSDQANTQVSNRHPDPPTPADSTLIETPGHTAIHKNGDTASATNHMQERTDLEDENEKTRSETIDQSPSAIQDPNDVEIFHQTGLDNLVESADSTEDAVDEANVDLVPTVAPTVVEDMGEVEKQLHAESSLSSRSPIINVPTHVLPSVDIQQQEEQQQSPTRSSVEPQTEPKPLSPSQSRLQTPEKDTINDDDAEDDLSPKTFVTPAASISPIQPIFTKSSVNNLQQEQNEPIEILPQDSSAPALPQSDKIVPSSQDDEETSTDEDKVDSRKLSAPGIIPELGTLKSLEEEENARPDLAVACENIDDCVHKKIRALEHDQSAHTVEQDVMPPDSFTPGKPSTTAVETLDIPVDEESVVTKFDMNPLSDEQAAVDQVLIEDEGGTAVADPLENTAGKEDKTVSDRDVIDPNDNPKRPVSPADPEDEPFGAEMPVDDDNNDRSPTLGGKLTPPPAEQIVPATTIQEPQASVDQETIPIQSNIETVTPTIPDSNTTALVGQTRVDIQPSVVESNTTTHVSTPQGKLTPNKHSKRPSGSLTRLIFTGRSTAPPSEVPDTADSTNASSRNSPAPSRMGTRAGSMSTASTPGRMTSRSTEAQRIISLAEAREQQTRIHQQQHLALQRHQKRKKYDVFDFATAVQAGGSLQAALGQAHKTLSTKNFQLLRREKQAIQTIQQVEQLQKAGLWTLRQPVQAVEPPRNMTHWDFLLKEMKWLSTDFKEGRKWNVTQAKVFAEWCKDWHETPESERVHLCVSRTPSGVLVTERPEDLVVIKTDEDEDQIMNDIDDALPDVKIEDVADQIYIPDAADMQNPGAIFSLGVMDTVFHMMPTASANKIMAELPMLSAPRPPSPGSFGLEIVPDRKPSPPMLSKKHAMTSTMDHNSGPPIKKSRYQYDPDYSLFDSGDSEDDVVSTPQKRRRLSYRSKANRSHGSQLEPENTECALFNPEFQPILHRLHNAHLFRPPVEMPPATFFEYRHPSQWTAADDEELKEAVKTYNHNWLLVSISLQPKSLFQSGADRRSLWECFERWVGLDPANAEHVKGPFFRPVQQRLELAARAPSHLATQAAAAAAATAAATVVAAPAVVTPTQPNGTPTALNTPVAAQAPMRRKTSQPMRVDRKRNTRCLSMFDQMRKLAKKREMQQSKQQHCKSSFLLQRKSITNTISSYCCRYQKTTRTSGASCSSRSSLGGVHSSTS